MPPAYTAQQKSAIMQFVSVTGADRTTAARCLKQNNWTVEAAVNSYFNVSAPSTPPASAASRTALTKLFESYQDPAEPGTINIDGTMEYLSALDLAPDDVGSIVMQEVVQAPSMGEISKDGFVAGWSSVGCDSVEKQKAFLKGRIASLSQPGNRDLLKRVYKFAFRLPLSGPNQKTIDKETACAMWGLFFTPPSLAWRTASTDWLALWLEFLTDKSSIKGVNMDVWDQTFKFAEEVLKDETLGWWDEMASWPGVIDEFIEWLKEDKGLLGGKAAEDEMEY